MVLQAGPEVGRGGASGLSLPRCEVGIGELIARSDSPRLIDGVRAAPVALWPDDRGCFLEIARLGVGLASGFESAQVSAARGYPGSVKAFHFHVKQTDLWVPFRGMLQVALCDLRRESPTFGVRNTLYLGELRPWQLLVPPGVAHGYKVIGDTTATLVYVTDRHYDPADEGRLPYDSPELAYDWEMQHK